MNTGHGLTLVFAGGVSGRRSTLPMNTARRHGLWTRVVCTQQPWTRPCWLAVISGVHRHFWPHVSLNVHWYRYYYYPFNGLFSRTTWVSRHQKGKPFWILLQQEMVRWQWHQLDHMQIICTSLQADNYASTLPVSFYRPDALPAAQPTASEHWRKIIPVMTT